CKILNPDGTVQNNCKRFPLLKNAFYTYLSLNRLNKDYDMDWFHYDKTIEVDQIATTFLMVRNEVLKKIDYFDVKYRILYNDVDLCKRIRSAGHKIFFIHTANIIHHGSQSTKKANFRIRTIMYNDIYRYYRRNFGFKAVFLIPVLYIRLMIIKYIR
ncbi:MAG: glycosyltransferase family 2 protein, partial [Ignavibacteria bacterium]